MKIKVDFSELVKFSKKFQSIDTDRIAQESVNDIAQVGLTNLRNYASVDTGYLRRNWTATSQIGGNRKQTKEIQLRNPTEYLVYVNYGHRYGAGLTKFKEGTNEVEEAMIETERSVKPIISENIRKEFKRVGL